MTTSPLRLSVVLPTYMRAEVLRRTLKHLAVQTLDPQTYEVIVIDDGSTDHTGEVVAEATKNSPCMVTYLHHPNEGPGFTQNRGIRAASAPLILLIADDILLAPEALEAHLSAHARLNSPQVAVLGHVVQSPELRQTAFQRKWDPFQMQRLKPHQELPYWMFWACNISLRRDFMLQRGMFVDARGSAGAAAHEDVEVGHRLAQHGLRIFHEKAALGFHFHAESLERAVTRSYERGLNWAEAYERMPNTELLIRQRLYGIDTLIMHRKEIAGERRAHLFPADRSVTRLAIDLALRSILFNAVTVPYFWMPLMRAAEQHPFVERLMLARFYRGVIVFEFRRAHRDRQLGTGMIPVKD